MNQTQSSFLLCSVAQDYYNRHYAVSPLVHMGVPQSTMPTSEQLAGRFESFSIKDSNKEGSEREYVYVDGEMETPPRSADGPPDYGPCEPTVSISRMEQWEKELLEDPKVRQ